MMKAVKNKLAAYRVSVSETTIFLLYLLAGAAFSCSRLPRFAAQSRPLAIIAALLSLTGITLHCQLLRAIVLGDGGINLSLANTASMIGLELALIALIAALEPTLRGISSGLMILGALAAAATAAGSADPSSMALDWQIQAHVLISLLSYGLITVGAIVAVYATLQERRLQAGTISTINNLFAPLETTEKLLFGIAAAGFAGLLLAILSGLTFVDNLFAQHLVHKTVFSILALVVFGTLLAGRFLAGWRGTRAVRLYLGGFLLLCLAYFGTRLILEQLNRSWG
jgi:ABC-type uncharacterized transport system permease subunit